MDFFSSKNCIFNFFTVFELTFFGNQQRYLFSNTVGSPSSCKKRRHSPPRLPHIYLIRFSPPHRSPRTQNRLRSFTIQIWVSGYFNHHAINTYMGTEEEGESKAYSLSRYRDTFQECPVSIIQDGLHQSLF